MKLLRGAVLFFSAMFVQWWWNSHLAYWGAAPQILLTLTVLVAARRGPVAAMLIGYAWGLYSDTLRADLFGADALLYALAGYAAGMVRRQMDLRAFGPMVATVFIVSLSYTLMLGLFGQIFLKSFYWVGWASFLAAPFLNAGIAVVCAIVWEASGDA